VLVCRPASWCSPCPGKSARRQRGTQSVNRSAQSAGDHPPGRTAVAHDRPADRWRTCGGRAVPVPIRGNGVGPACTRTCSSTICGGSSTRTWPRRASASGTLRGTWAPSGRRSRRPLRSPWRVGKRPYGRAVLGRVVSEGVLSAAGRAGHQHRAGRDTGQRVQGSDPRRRRPGAGAGRQVPAGLRPLGPRHPHLEEGAVVVPGHARPGPVPGRYGSCRIRLSR
jgi:hypothetical protein